MAKQYEELDVLIVGAGISGIGMAYKMKKERPYDSFAVIEARDNIGGTWDLFKYPGIRSDSDMYTFSYSFKPWTDREYVATGDRIMHYLNELVREELLDHYIRFSQRVTAANWDSSAKRWFVTITRGDGSEYHIKAKFLSCCGGYYDYDQGYLPEWEGYKDFKGTIAHPQKWPEDLDYSGKKVVVIGSGATAVTVVPTMAMKAEKVTMVQRSPAYVVARPARDALFLTLSKFLPKGITNRIMRLKYTTMQQMAFLVSKKFPAFVRKLVRHLNQQELKGAVDVDVHFKPKYNPWDQRMALVPDSDLFKLARAGKVGIETDHIDRFTKTGIKLKSGKEIEADIIVPATGLKLQLWGKMNLTVDGNPVEGNNLTIYKGTMFSQVPNFLWVFGYTNSSWTLKAEVTYNYMIRLLNHMEKHGYESAYPHLENHEEAENPVALQSGYILRSLHFLPKSGSSFPWCNKDLYMQDLVAVKHSKIADGTMRFNDCSALKQFHEPSDANVAPIEKAKSKAA